MEFFDLPYYLIQRDARNAREDLARCEERIKNLQAYLRKLLSKTAASIGKVMNKTAPRGMQLELVAGHRHIDIVATMVNSRFYGTAQKRIKESVIAESFQSEGPSQGHLRIMNSLRKQIKSFHKEKSKGYTQLQRDWMFKHKKSNKPLYVDIRRIRYLAQFDLSKYNRELQIAASLQRKMQSLQDKADARISAMDAKHAHEFGTCPLCLEDDYRVVRLKCGHLFHAECITNLLAGMIKEWKRAPTVKCPMCRFVLN
jgi:hypothetical protein